MPDIQYLNQMHLCHDLFPKVSRMEILGYFHPNPLLKSNLTDNLEHKQKSPSTWLKTPARFLSQPKLIPAKLSRNFAEEIVFFSPFVKVTRGFDCGLT